MARSISYPGVFVRRGEGEVCYLTGLTLPASHIGKFDEWNLLALLRILCGMQREFKRRPGLLVPDAVTLVFPEEGRGLVELQVMCTGEEVPGGGPLILLRIWDECSIVSRHGKSPLRAYTGRHSCSAALLLSWVKNRHSAAFWGLHGVAGVRLVDF